MGNKGLTLVEVLVVLLMSSVVMAAVYSTLISQQHTYRAQDQVVEMQQSIRTGLDLMIREVRMAGYGGKILTTFGNVNTFSTIITPVNGTPHDTLTVLLADDIAALVQNAPTGSNQLALNIPAADKVFDIGKKKYLCLNGQNNYLVQSVSGNTVTLATALLEDHLTNESVSLVKAITYRIEPGTTDLIRDENAGEGGQILSNHVEDLQLSYTLADGTVLDLPGTPSDIRVIHIVITGRTAIPDSRYMNDGYRRQTMTATVEIRNLGL